MPAEAKKFHENQYLGRISGTQTRQNQGWKDPG
jgi:hypothetical protein